MNEGAYLGFDIGAESGRAILGRLENGELKIRELHRFANGIIEVRGRLHWNIYRLFEELVRGLKVCAAAGERPVSLGIDTWGVDFGLVAADGELIGLPFAYRDPRFPPAMETFLRRVPREKVFPLTGTQFLPFNSLYQLAALVEDRSSLLAAAAGILFIPDIFHYLLTGVKRTEFTFASTTQLFDPFARRWSPELLAALGLPARLFQPIVMPGELLGEIDPAIARSVGLPPLPVAVAATHDTASAVAAAPAQGEDWAFISSGTWSLVGIEARAPMIDERALAGNFANEAGVGGGFRVLKNVMGLWLVQRCRAAWADDGALDYARLAEMAAAAPPFGAVIDPDDPGFLNPPDMPAAIMQYCRRTGQTPPGTPGEMIRCVLESLALKYRCVLDRLQELADRPITRIHIIGGGARNRLLCQFTADAAGRPVIAGPIEATAIGNLLVQAMAGGAAESLAEIRAICRRSFALEKYQPEPGDRWEEAYRRLCGLNPV